MTWRSVLFKLMNVASSIMTRPIALDTNAVISYYSNIFEEEPTISGATLSLIEEGLVSRSTDIVLIVPSTVFVELFERWLDTEEFRSKVYYEVYLPLRQRDNVAILPVSFDCLYRLLEVEANLSKHDLHDKLVVAAAIEMSAELVTSDQRIISFARMRPDLLRVLS